MKIPYIQRTGISIFINHFWDKNRKNAMIPKCKTTEPETVYFLKPRGELAAPLALCI
jgi:hypothetical protein